MRQTLSVFYCTANCEAGITPKSDGKSWHTQWIKDGADPAPCPHCGAQAVSKPNPMVAGPAYLSDALGVAPNQIAEAKKAFPHHEFAPDGRMVIKNPQHRKQVMKEIGYTDYQ